MSIYDRDTRTDRERALEYELDRYREADEQRRARQDREWDEQRRETRERIEQAERSADTWPEALRKNVYLLRREVSDVPDETDLDNFFEHSAEACQYALALWRERELAVAEQIAALEAQIAALRDGVRLAVAEALDADGHNRAACRQVASALREMTPEQFLQW